MCGGPIPPKADGQCGELIDAVVHLTQDIADSLREENIANHEDVKIVHFDPQQRDGLFPGGLSLHPYLPKGRYQTSSLINSRFSTETHGAKIYLHETLPVLAIDGSST